MTWEQMFAAIQALGEASLCMRRPGDWYVEQRGTWVKERASDSVLGNRYGNGETPEAAVRDHWRQHVDELRPDAFIVLSGSGKPRRHVRWNGYMWVDLPVECGVRA